MCSRIFIIVWIAFGTSVAAAPAPVQSVTWQSEPNVRGTWSIFLGCATTLFLCVYTAVHMNTPPANSSLTSRRWSLACWVLYGVFAPELVVWTAWCQWSGARLLTREMQALRAELDPKDESTQLQAVVSDEIQLLSKTEPHPIYIVYNGDVEALRKLLDSWTLAHSFFVIMGGYQFRPEAVKTKSYSGWPEIVLHKKCFLSLLRHGHAANIPLLSAEELADRSKADSLAKTLSALQGTWLILQLLGRVIDRLTITELEVNTFAHVLCALTIYVLWMYKPFNVQLPTFVASHGLETWLSLHTADYRTASVLVKCKAVLKDTLAGSQRPVTHVHTRPIQVRECRQCLDNLALSEQRPIHALCLLSDVKLTTEEVAWFVQQNNSDRYSIDFVYKMIDGVPGSTVHNSAEVQCSDLNESDLSQLLELWRMPERDHELDRFDSGAAPTSSADMMSTDAPNRLSKFIIMVFISSVYGGLHASLWNHQFPSAAEMWMWRISSIVVAGYAVSIIIPLTVVLILAWILTAEVDEIKDIFWGHDIFKFVRGCLKMTSAILDYEWVSTLCICASVLGVIVWILLLLFCRIFLFLDAFLTLRSQPPSVYQTPQWSQWLPHL